MLESTLKNSGFFPQDFKRGEEKTVSAVEDDEDEKEEEDEVEKQEEEAQEE